MAGSICQKKSESNLKTIYCYFY